MTVVPISGLFESHLTVADIVRSVGFYRDVLGLRLAHRIAARHCAFFWIGPPGHTMLGLWSVHSSPISARLHIAFTVALDDVVGSVGKLRAAGVTPRSGGGGAEISEPIVHAWMPAASVYFDDPDGHSLEFIAMLPEPARPELGIVSMSTWRAASA